MATDTFIVELEEVTDEVARWGATYVKDILDALAPDGRPFGGVKQSTEEQLEIYRTMRNDVESWKLWVSDKASTITNMLLGSGVSPEMMTVVNPLKIATQFALDYSIRMEKELTERMVT